MTTAPAPVKWQHLITRAERIGTEQGRAAASWVEIADREDARRILAGLNDIDPVILDALPNAPTGEYADDYSRADLYSELEISGAIESDDLALWHAYADAFHDAVCDSVERRCLEWVA